MASVYEAPIDAPRINSTMVNSFHARSVFVVPDRDSVRQLRLKASLKFGLFRVQETSRRSTSEIPRDRKRSELTLRVNSPLDLLERELASATRQQETDSPA